MISRFIDKRKKSVIALAAVGVVAIALGLGLSRARAASRQAPQRGAAGAARGRGGRGGFGGFTHPVPINLNDHAGWISLFNGKNLDGWTGNPSVWHVKDGAIVGTSSPQHPAGSTNIIYAGHEYSNFMLQVQFKMVGAGANGGVQYRSQNKPPKPRAFPAGRGGRGRGARGPGGRQMTAAQIAQMEALRKKDAKWAMQGYQADMDYANRFTGQMYEQGTGRGIIAWPGNVVVTFAGQKPALVASAATTAQIKSWIHVGGWNQYLIIADGHTMIHIINGHIISILVDQNPKYAATKGLIGFEIEGGGTLAISYRDIWLKHLPL